MKVLYFHQHFATPRGSGGVRSYAMARRLLERGHQVTMVCGSIRGGHTGLTTPFEKGRRRGLVDGIDVIELDLAYSNRDGFIQRTITFAKFALRSLKLAMLEEYDLVFATTTPLTAGIPGIFARWLRHKPFVFEVRDLWPELPKAMGVIKNPLVLGAMSILEWLSYRSADHVIGLAPGIVEGIKKRGVKAERISLVPNGCDIDLSSSGNAPWRPEGISHSDLMAVYAGTHGIANGLKAVLDAAVELKRRNRDDIKFLLIGNGKLKEDLQARANKEDLKNVIFHDPVDKSKLFGLMSATDIGMQILANVPAFYFGTSPNKFFDYIAAGVPVINNYSGWLADLIQKNDCGFAVPPEDPIAFADALEEASRDRKRLQEMGLRARQLAEQKFSRKILADCWVDAIEKTMGHSSSEIATRGT